MMIVYKYRVKRLPPSLKEAASTLKRQIRQLVKNLLSIIQLIGVTVRIPTSVIADCRDEFLFFVC